MSLALVITLALNASKQEVIEAIDAIEAHFGGSGISPTEAATIASLPAAASVPVVAGIATSGNVDSDGLPWDDRIHSSSKAFNADGTWRSKRGIDKSLIKKVETELRATMGATVNPTPAAVISTIVNPAAAAAAGAAAAAVAAAPAALSLPPIPGAAPTVDPLFTNFVQFIVANTNSPTNPAGRLTDEWVTVCLANYGVAEGSLQNLAHRTDLIPTIEAGIKSALGIA